MKLAILSLIIVAVLFLTVSRVSALSSSVNNPCSPEVSITLIMDAVRGFNNSIPGPTITVFDTDSVTWAFFTFIASDNASHQFKIADFSFMWGRSLGLEPAPIWNNISASFFVFQFFGDTTNPGHYEYYDMLHPETCYGFIIVRPFMTLKTIQDSYHSSIGEARWSAPADLDNNGMIGLSDLVAYSVYFHEVNTVKLPNISYTPD